MSLTVIFHHRNFAPMVVALHRLSAGHYYLDFEESDIPIVTAAIRERFGAKRGIDWSFSNLRNLMASLKARYHVQQAVHRIRTHAPHVFPTTCVFGGSSFTFTNEWDDPCLIAGTDEGDEILKALHAKIVLAQQVSQDT
ncbi:MAG: hypothetical protein ABJL99_05710 [Aliishimia sp.]